VHRWCRARSSTYAPDFLDQLEAIGVETPAWDRLTYEAVDDVLCGASIERLDAEYPVRTTDGLRILLTESAPGVPPLRVAFRIEPNGDVCYVAASLRLGP
jgi:hypothetical protein